MSHFTDQGPHGIPYEELGQQQAEALPMFCDDHPNEDFASKSSVCCGAHEHGDVEGFCGACGNGTGFEWTCPVCGTDIEDDKVFNMVGDWRVCSKTCYDRWIARHPEDA